MKRDFFDFYVYCVLLGAIVVIPTAAITEYCTKHAIYSDAVKNGRGRYVFDEKTGTAAFEWNVARSGVVERVGGGK